MIRQLVIPVVPRHSYTTTLGSARFSRVPGKIRSSTHLGGKRVYQAPDGGRSPGTAQIRKQAAVECSHVNESSPSTKHYGRRYAQRQ